VGSATARSQDLVVPGLGPSRTNRLLQTFGSVEALRNATVEEIAALPGFGRGTAQRVHQALR
jgi:excinuclease ABC subunit C